MGKYLLGPPTVDFVTERGVLLREYLQGLLNLEPLANAAEFLLREFLGLPEPVLTNELEIQAERTRLHWMVRKGRRGGNARSWPLEYSAVEVFEVAVTIAISAGAVAARTLRAASPATAKALRRLLPLLFRDFKTILVCGGSTTTSQDSVLRFRPGTGSWEMLPDMKMPRRVCAAASLDGACIVLGGLDPRCASEKSEVAAEHTTENWSERFDPVAQTWRLLGPCGHPFTHAAAAASGGFVYVFGGLSSGRLQSSSHRLDPVSLHWQGLKPMPTPRMESAAAAVSGQLYVVGGASASGEPLAVLESYDPSVGKWTPGMPSMHYARFGCAAAPVGRRLVVLGGHCRGESLGCVETFDSDRSRWEVLVPMPTLRNRCGAAVAGGRLYVFGGSDGTKDHDGVDSLDISPSSVAHWTWRVDAPMPRAFGQCVAVVAVS